MMPNTRIRNSKPGENRGRKAMGLKPLKSAAMIARLPNIRNAIHMSGGPGIPAPATVLQSGSLSMTQAGES
jgi:hypothetical protein